MAQYFKGDEKELKFYDSGEPLLTALSMSKDDMFDDAYECQAFGDIIFHDSRAPLSNAIKKEIFRQTFNEVFQNFQVAGSFESYIAVFQKIFGEGAVIDFTVPAPGKLLIDIEAEGIELSEFIARVIVDNQYEFDQIIDDEGDNIVFQTVKGFQSQYELEQMLYEMVPDGIYTEITLTLG